MRKMYTHPCLVKCMTSLVFVSMILAPWSSMITAFPLAASCVAEMSGLSASVTWNRALEYDAALAPVLWHPLLPKFGILPHLAARYFPEPLKSGWG
jgi:hypothetical protein